MYLIDVKAMEGETMHEVKFIGNYSAAIAEEPEYDNGVFECG